jgi:invasion protein IalB
VKSIRHQRVKLLMAAAIASGLVAIGAVAAVAVSQQQTGTVNGSPMTIGETATTTTPPAAPPTAKASPTMKAVPPKGF